MVYKGVYILQTCFDNRDSQLNKTDFFSVTCSFVTYKVNNGCSLLVVMVTLVASFIGQGQITVCIPGINRIKLTPHALEAIVQEFSFKV